jgi:nitroreductase
MNPADFLDLVRKRQSVRGCSPRPVEKAKIERCVEAARLAPSACNAQPWTFIIKACDLLKIPAGKRLGLIITLGYPPDEKIRPKIRKELRRMVRWNSYR